MNSTATQSKVFLFLLLKMKCLWNVFIKKSQRTYKTNICFTGKRMTIKKTRCITVTPLNFVETMTFYSMSHLTFRTFSRFSIQFLTGF